jgi:hypothetical protein
MTDEDLTTRTRKELQLLAPEVTRGLAARLRLTHLLRRFPERPVWALFMFINGFITIAILAAVAMVSHTPFVFPSLGPTAFLVFFTPDSPTASPRHTVYGHAIGIACGYGALWVTGLVDAARREGHAHLLAREETRERGAQAAAGADDEGSLGHGASPPGVGPERRSAA